MKNLYTYQNAYTCESETTCLDCSSEFLLYLISRSSCFIYRVPIANLLFLSPTQKGVDLIHFSFIPRSFFPFLFEHKKIFACGSSVLENGDHVGFSFEFSQLYTPSYLNFQLYILLSMRNINYLIRFSEYFEKKNCFLIEILKK